MPTTRNSLRKASNAARNTGTIETRPSRALPPPCHSYFKPTPIPTIKLARDEELERLAVKEGSAIPPGLIYQGESKDMMDSWLQDFDHSKDNAWFTVSEKGWTDNSIGLA